MEEFYQQFKDNLENRPEPPFDPSAWADLERKIERAGKTSGLAFNWWWAAVPLLLLLLSSNFFLYRQLYRNNQQIGTILLQRDTIVQRQVVYQVDTVYQTRIVREAVPIAAGERALDPAKATAQRLWNLPGAVASGSGFTLTTSGNNFDPSQQPLTLGRLRRQISDDAFSSASAGGSQLQPAKEIGGAVQKPAGLTFKELPLVAPDPLAYSTDQSFSDYPLRTMEYQRRKRLYLDQYLLPTAFEAGTYVGSELLTDSKIGGFSIGLTGNTYFGDRLQLWFEGGRSQFRIKTTKTGGLFGLNDKQPSPLDDFTLTNIEASPRYWQVAAGLQFLFNTQSAWQPLVGAGFSVFHLDPFRAEYKFSNPLTGQGLELYESIGADGNTSYFTSQLGLRYQLHKRLAVQVSGQYRYAFEQENNLGIGSSVAMRMGIFYRL